MSKLTKDKIIELESLRGIAAILVVYAHMPNWHNFFESPIKANAYLMVDFFFVLSGFVIYTNYQNKINNFKDLFKFQFLRFGRLYPVHISIILLYIVFYSIKYFYQTYINMSFLSPVFDGGFMTELVSNIFLLQGFTNNEHIINPPSWSISLEFYTYLIFALVILRNQFKLFYFLTFSLVPCFILYSGKTYGMENLFRCLAGFFMGCLSVMIASKIKGYPRIYLSFLIGIFFVIFLIFKGSAEYDVFVYLISSALIISLAAYPKGKLNEYLKLPAFLWLGKMSYPIYMSHFIFIWIMQVFVEKFLRVSNVDKKYLLSFSKAFAIYLLFYLAVFIVASFLHKYIEEPIRKKTRFFIKNNNEK